MNIEVTPGRYVVAVSGGVDSMVLLDLLATNYLSQAADYHFIVAHFDHGIRDDSVQDRLLVQATAAKLGLPFVYANGRLGTSASEALARDARYGFLHETRRVYGAQSIITAHHQGDVLETAIINMLRGTKRRGLGSLQTTATIARPLLSYAKADLLAYAKEHGVVWREDSTNSDERYLRNYVRKQILTKFSDEQKDQLLQLITASKQTNRQIDTALANLLHVQPAAMTIDRSWFVLLPHEVARELMASWLRGNGIADFDAKALERLVIAAKVSYPGKTIDVVKNWQLAISANRLALRQLER